MSKNMFDSAPSLFEIPASMRDLSVPINESTSDFLNYINQKYEQTDPHELLAGGAAAAFGFAAGNMLRIHPLMQGAIAALSGYIGSQFYSHLFVHNETTREANLKIPTGAEAFETLNLGTEEMNFLTAELTTILEIENHFATTHPPLLIPRSFIVIIETIVRIFLLDNMKPALRQTVCELVKPSSRDEIQQIIEGKRCSMGSIARWFQVIEDNINTLPELQIYFKERIGGCSIFSAENMGLRLSQILRTLTRTRNLLVHNPIKLKDKNPHLDIISKLFGQDTLQNWWSSPIDTHKPMNQLLFGRYILHVTNHNSI